MSRYDLTDFEWRVIAPLLPNKPRGAAIRGAVARSAGALRPTHHLLQPLCAMAEVGRVGPADGRHHRRARRRHPDDRQHLRSRSPAGRDGKKGGADHCLGRSRGGLTTKIHVVVDAQGLPIRLGLTAGQTHDGQIANALLDHLGPRTIVLADKAYDADRIREMIQDQGATPNIPPKSNRRWKPCFSKRLYRERNLIERFFSKLKHFRLVDTATTRRPTSVIAARLRLLQNIVQLLVQVRKMSVNRMTFSTLQA